MTNKNRIEKALLDPPAVFSTPTDVLNDAELTEAQKIEILRRWEYDACEISVAEDEGMPIKNHVMLDEILQALHQLVPEINTDRSPPTKQGGLDRASLKSRQKKT